MDRDRDRVCFTATAPAIIRPAGSIPRCSTACNDTAFPLKHGTARIGNIFAVAGPTVDVVFTIGDSAAHDVFRV